MEEDYIPPEHFNANKMEEDEEEIDEQTARNLLLFEYHPITSETISTQLDIQKDNEILNDISNRETLIKIQLPSLYTDSINHLMNKKEFLLNQMITANKVDDIEMKRSRQSESTLIQFHFSTEYPEDDTISSFINSSSFN